MTCSPANTVSASRACSRVKRHWNGCPPFSTDGLRGGVIYYDGQFDDTRLLIHLAATAAEQGATLINYAAVSEITRDADGFANGVIAVDRESGERLTAPAKVVVNAAGIFADEVRRLADPPLTAMIAPSQGIHLVFERSFLRGHTAIMVPHTSDGRVLFAIPWHEHTLVGTTDTPIEEPSYNPLPFEQEIEFILETAAQYLSRPPKRSDVLSVYVGIRPLVKAGQRAEQDLLALARSHHPRRQLRAGHDRGWQVDHLSSHGGGLRGPRDPFRRTCGRAEQNPKPEDPWL